MSMTRATLAALAVLTAPAAVPADATTVGGSNPTSVGVMFATTIGSHSLSGSCAWKKLGWNAATFAEITAVGTAASTVHSSAPSLTVQCTLHPSGYALGGITTDHTRTYTVSGNWSQPSGVCIYVRALWSPGADIWHAECAGATGPVEHGPTVAVDVGTPVASAGVSGGGGSLPSCDPATPCEAGDLVAAAAGIAEDPRGRVVVDAAGGRTEATVGDGATVCHTDPSGDQVCAP